MSIILSSNPQDMVVFRLPSGFSCLSFPTPCFFPFSLFSGAIFALRELTHSLTHTLTQNRSPASGTATSMWGMSCENRQQIPPERAQQGCMLRLTAPHNPKVVGSNPAPATMKNPHESWICAGFLFSFLAKIGICSRNVQVNKNISGLAPVWDAGPLSLFYPSLAGSRTLSRASLAASWALLRAWE